MASSQTNVYQLPLEQLEGLKKQLDQDVRSLGAAYDGLYNGRNSYLDNQEAIELYRKHSEKAKASGETQEVFVCMTSSLFVRGEVVPKDSVIVDVGTGYFLEQSMTRAKDYYGTRAAQLKESMDSLEKTIVTKQKQQNQVIDAMQQKAAAMQAYQAANQA